MTSKSSYSKSGLLRFNLRRDIWAVAISATAFFLSILLPVIMAIQSYTGEAQMQPYVLSSLQSVLYRNIFSKFIMCVLAVAVGVHAFSYLHSRQKTDFHHSLPISRRQLFLVQFAGGIFTVLPAYLIMQAAAIVVVHVSGFGEACSGIHILTLFLIHSIMFLCIYALAVLCTILCGNTVVSLLLFGWAVFSPSGAVALSVAMRDFFYEGFYRAFAAEKFMLRLSPVIAYFRMGAAYGEYTQALLFQLLAYAAAAILLTGLAVALFCIRKSEKAGNALAFDKMRIPFKLWCMAIIGLSTGLLMGTIMNEVTLWLYFGLVLGCVLTHCIVETVYEFDFKAVLKHGRTLIIGCALLILVSAGMQADITGYNTYIPNAGSVKGVNVRTYQIGRGTWLESSDMLRESENIEAALALAHFSEDPKSLDWDKNYYYWMPIGFELTSGRTVWRGYYVQENAQTKDYLEQIFYSEEYVTIAAPAFQAKLTGNDRLQIVSLARGWNDTRVSTVNQEQIADIIHMVRQETLAQTAEQAKREIPVFSLELNNYRDITDPDSYIGWNAEIYVYEGFTQTLALIEQYTGFAPQTLGGSDVASLNIIRMQHLDSDVFETVEAQEWWSDEMDTYAPTNRIEQNKQITDKEEIAQILESGKIISHTAVYSSDWGGTLWNYGYESGEWTYMLDIYLTDGSYLNAYYLEGEMPIELLASYFEEQ